MTHDTPLQDAVTLAADLQRTPVQQAAKHAFEGLCEAEDYCIRLELLVVTSQRFDLARAQRRIEEAMEAISLLMHEDDCE